MKEGKGFEMAIKIHLRRFASVLLCCLLVFCSLPVQVHATDPVTAASLAITGGQLAGAGLSGEAALSLAGPVGAVVGVTLGTLGVNAYVSKAAQEAGKTRTRFVLDKLVIWGAQAGYTQEQLYSKIAQGISVAADGTIQLANDVAQTIQQFGNWLFTQEGTVVPPPSDSSSSSINFGSVGSSLYASSVIVNENLRYWAYSFSPTDGVTPENVAFVGIADSPSSTTARLLLVNKSSFYASVNYGGGGTSGQATYYNNYHVFINNRYLYPVTDLRASGVMIYAGTLDSFLQSITEFSPVDAVPAQDCFLGDATTWDQNKDLLNPASEDTPIVLNPDLLNPIIDSLADGQQATMSIIDYLQALQDAWDHALDDVQTAIGTITDSLTGIQEQIAVPQDAVENPTVTNPSVTPDTTPILNPSDVDPGTAITGLSFDLTNIFPFCIPFDIYAALNLLDAEPVAPSYHVHLEWPYNIIIDFTIDLSPFNDVAAVARTMETLLFIVGLAVMTRSMFIRG